MRNNLAPHRPALAAIAAVLALSTAPAGAQLAPVESGPAVEAPPPVPVVPEAAPAIVAPPAAEPVEAAPVQIAPAAEVVQAVPPVAEETPPAPRQSAAAERATRSAPVVGPRAEAVPMPPPRRAPEAPIMPLPADLAPPAIQPAPAATAQPAVRAADSSNIAVAWWVMGVGGLLVAGGLTTLAFAPKRRPRPDRTVESLAPAMAPAQPMPARPASAASPLAVPVVAAPAMAMPATAPTPLTVSGSRFPELEAMIAAPPSAGNPFLTRKKRLRRAHYMLSHGAPRTQHDAVAPRRETVAAAAPAQQPQLKPQPAYRFGKAQSPRFIWKPATS